MGRSPCCDKVGVKKGPWTPEEDIVLVSYIQQHGPGNWRMVPAHTGLLRCSKSCRLRWTNYLRPGIRRGNFTSHEDRIIVHLQALLGNRWAAIASYLPQRTDNDIKNYWNTHLKKRLKKQQSPVGNEITRTNNVNSYSSPAASKGQWESKLQTDIHHAKQALFEALNCSDSSNSDLKVNENALNHVDPISTQRNLNPSSPYASSIENFSKLLEGWKRSSENELPNDIKLPNSASTTSSCSDSQSPQYSTIPISSSNNQMECLNIGSFAWTSPFSSCEDDKTSADHFHLCQPVNFNNSVDNGLPFSVLEEWLMEETNQDQFSHVNQLVQELGCI